jgi:hypothetical protein
LAEPNLSIHTATALSENNAGESLNRRNNSFSKPGHRERALAYSTVGTPDYIAPEVYFLVE